MSRTFATDRHFTFYRLKSLQEILSVQHPSTLEQWRALNTAAQLVTSPPPKIFSPTYDVLKPTFTQGKAEY